MQSSKRDGHSSLSENLVTLGNETSSFQIKQDSSDQGQWLQCPNLSHDNLLCVFLLNQSWVQLDDQLGQFILHVIELFKPELLTILNAVLYKLNVCHPRHVIDLIRSTQNLKDRPLKVWPFRVSLHGIHHNFRIFCCISWSLRTSPLTPGPNIPQESHVGNRHPFAWTKFLAVVSSDGRSEGWIAFLILCLWLLQSIDLENNCYENFENNFKLFLKVFPLKIDNSNCWPCSLNCRILWS